MSGQVTWPVCAGGNHTWTWRDDTECERTLSLI